MPFGISSAPEVFQCRVHQVIEGLDGAEVIADDFLVYGRAIRDHDKQLKKFLVVRTTQSSTKFGQAQIAVS